MVSFLPRRVKYKIVCPKCGKKFLYKLHLEIHLQNCSGRGFICPLCSNVFPNILMLKSHVYKSHGHLWHKCPICNKEYKSIGVHYHHKWLHNNDPEHALLWALTGCGRQKENKKQIFNDAYKILQEVKVVK